MSACVICNKEFQPTKYSKGYLCSSVCIRSFISQSSRERAAKIRALLPPTPPCRRCGKPCKRTGGQLIYCSRFCAGLSVGLRGDRRRRNPPIQLRCPVCGAERQLYHRKQRFCSRRCAGAGRAKTYRNNGRIDLNQQAIIDALRNVGAAVLDTSSVGGGCCDLIVGFRKENFLIEVKNPDNSYGRNGFNKRQQQWNRYWAGRTPEIAYSIDDALNIIAGQV